MTEDLTKPPLFPRFVLSSPWIELFLISTVRGKFHGPIVMQWQFPLTSLWTRQELKDSKDYEILPMLPDCSVVNSAQNVSTGRRCKIRKPISEKKKFRTVTCLGCGACIE